MKKVLTIACMFAICIAFTSCKCKCKCEKAAEEPAAVESVEAAPVAEEAAACEGCDKKCEGCDKKCECNKAAEETPAK